MRTINNNAKSINERKQINLVMCRIEAVDCRSIYRKIADGGCICSLDVMLSEMKHITNEVEKLGNKAVFVMD